MTEYFVVMLPASAKPNLDAAVRHGVWGWSTTSLDAAGTRRRLEGETVAKSLRERIDAIQVGDRIFFAIGAEGRSPGRRYEPGRHIALERLILGEVVRAHYQDTSAVWDSQEPYAERIAFELLGEWEGVDGSSIGADFCEALSRSLRGRSPLPVDPEDLDLSISCHGEDQAEAASPGLPAGPPDHSRTNGMVSVMLPSARVRISFQATGNDDPPTVLLETDEMHVEVDLR